MFIDELGHYRSSEDKIKQRNTRHKGGGGVSAKGHGIWLLTPIPHLSTAETQQRNLWAGKSLTGHDCQQEALTSMREILHHLLQHIANIFIDASAYSKIVFKTFPKISWWVRAGRLQNQQIQPHTMPYKKHKGKGNHCYPRKKPREKQPLPGQGLAGTASLCSAHSSCSTETPLHCRPFTTGVLHTKIPSQGALTWSIRIIYLGKRSQRQVYAKNC